MLTDLSSGRTRAGVIEAIIELATDRNDVVAGLDFAFSAPAWFLAERGVTSALELWKLVAAEGEGWLQACRPPLWGRPGKPRPELPAHLRRTELELSPAKSVFQIGGAGAVGTGSIRGMPCLLRLQEAGFSIWPFDQPGWPRVVEIYPRALTGPVHKRDVSARARYLEAIDLPDALRRRAEASEDAFDAAVSALVMSAAQAEFVLPGDVADPLAALEGLIWVPVAEPATWSACAPR